MSHCRLVLFILISEAVVIGIVNLAYTLDQADAAQPLEPRQHLSSYSPLAEPTDHNSYPATLVLDSPERQTPTPTPTAYPHITCPPGGIQEGEPICGPDYVDTYNGGCGSIPPVFQDLSCGSTICATSGNFLEGSQEIWDTDWYRIEISTQSLLHWSVLADYPVMVIIMDAGSENCSDYTLLAWVTGEPYLPASIMTPVESGTYWLWVGPAEFTGYDCPRDYVAWVECEPIPLVPATNWVGVISLIITISVLKYIRSACRILNLPGILASASTAGKE